MLFLIDRNDPMWIPKTEEERVAKYPDVDFSRLDPAELIANCKRAYYEAVVAAMKGPWPANDLEPTQ